MKTIPLTRGYVAKVDDADYYRCIARGKWCAHTNGRNVYAERKISKKNSKGGRQTVEKMHSFILNTHHQVDHRNNDGLDNRRKNLRKATTSQNQHNARTRVDNTSGFKGVAWDRNAKKWAAYVYLKGKRVWSALFLSKTEAHKRRNLIVKRYHRNFSQQ
jgi:hypothetical protein